MNTSGFLPLIEAFLAFALTMLALTTAVASIVGVWQRLFRWRANGLRDTVEYLFRNTLRPRLEACGDHRNAAAWDAARRQFMAEMTLAPVPQVANKNGGSADWRVQTITESENSGFKRWRSLRHGMDWLSDADFRDRFGDSTSGFGIAARADSQETENLLLRRFKALGNAATEAFGRRSRVLTIIAGFLFAFGVNIDSINLFNTYLSDPALRNQVIQNQEEILKNTTNADFAASIDENHSQVANTLQEFSVIVREMENAISAAGDAADSIGLDGALDLARKAEAGLQQVQDELVAVEEDSREIQAAYTDIRSIAVGVTQSFPVGWNQYPNCTSFSSDARCILLTTSGRLGQGPVYDASPAMFWRWILGVLLTGIMVGLGTPFWVKAVNGAMAARNWVQKGERDEAPPAEDKTPAADSSATPTTTTISSGPQRPVIHDLDKALQVARAAAPKTGKQ